jgi:hypothetical protein
MDNRATLYGDRKIACDEARIAYGSRDSACAPGVTVPDRTDDFLDEVTNHAAE